MADYCKNCPMFWHSRDYWGEYDEGCNAYKDYIWNGKPSMICRMPVFIKKVVAKYLKSKEERYWKQHIKKYEEDNELNNTENSKKDCFIAEKNIAYPLCVGRDQPECEDCQLRAEWEPEDAYGGVH